MGVKVEYRSLVPYCPLLKDKCYGKKCAWYAGKECSLVRIAKNLGKVKSK